MFPLFICQLWNNVHPNYTRSTFYYLALVCRNGTNQNIHIGDPEKNLMFLRVRPSFAARPRARRVASTFIVYVKAVTTTKNHNSDVRLYHQSQSTDTVHKRMQRQSSNVILSTNCIHRGTLDQFTAFHIQHPPIQCTIVAAPCSSYHTIIGQWSDNAGNMCVQHNFVVASMQCSHFDSLTHHGIHRRAW